MQVFSLLHRAAYTFEHQLATLPNRRRKDNLTGTLLFKSADWLCLLSGICHIMQALEYHSSLFVVAPNAAKPSADLRKVRVSQRGATDP